MKELSGEFNGALEVSKASLRLSEHVEKMVQKLEAKLAHVRPCTAPHRVTRTAGGRESAGP